MAQNRKNLLEEGAQKLSDLMTREYMTGNAKNKISRYPLQNGDVREDRKNQMCASTREDVNLKRRKNLWKNSVRPG